jgi:hypothetical protein
MRLFGMLLILVLGIGLGVVAWYLEWQPIPLFSLVLLFPSLYLLDYYSTMKGLERGQEEANPFVRRYFQTGNLGKDLPLPLLALTGLAVLVGTTDVLAPTGYVCMGLYLGVFIHNGLLPLDTVPTRAGT